MPKYEASTAIYRKIDDPPIKHRIHFIHAKHEGDTWEYCLTKGDDKPMLSHISVYRVKEEYIGLWDESWQGSGR